MKINYLKIVGLSAAVLFVLILTESAFSQASTIEKNQLTSIEIAQNALANEPYNEAIPLHDVISSKRKSELAEEVVKFEIMHKKKSLGFVMATREYSGGNELYTITSDISKQVLTIKKLRFDLKIAYSNGQLVKSDYELHVNGKLKKSSHLIWEKEGYKREINGKIEDVYRDPIYFSSVKLLFGPADNVKRTFSEAKLVYRDLFYENNMIKIGKSAKNTDTDHVYVDKVLKRIEISDFINFQMLKVE